MRARHPVTFAAILALASCPLAWGEQGASPLPRRGCLGAQVVNGTRGVVVVGVVPDGPAKRAGITAPDQILAVNGEPIGANGAATYLRGHAEGEEVTLTILRDGTHQDVKTKLVAPRTPDLPGAMTEFAEVPLADGTRVRTVWTVPFPSNDRPEPAILFIQHTDCSTIDPEVAQAGAWFDLVDTVAQSGYITMRVDKPGVGDSEGADCSALDFEAEVDVFRAALASLLADPRVDRNRVFLVASRGGTTIAPLLASEVDLAGVCAIGPVIRPWNEHLMDLMRRQSRDWNMSPMQAEKMLHDCSELFARVIVLGEEPLKVAEHHPELAPLVESLGGERMFGRSAPFHHQLNDADLAAAWSLTETDVLVLRGEYDRYTTVEDQDLIARLVNGPTGSRAWTATIPKTDPELNPQPSMDYYKTKWSAIQHGPNPELRDTVLDWLAFAATNAPTPPMDDGVDPALQVERETPGKPAS